MSCNTTPFDHRPVTRIVYGPNTVDEAGKFAVELGAKRVLVVTDPGIVAAGHVDRLVDTLRSASLDAVIFQDVIENPTTREVRECADRARVEQIDTLIGLGGGSSLDTARGANFLLTSGGEMRDYWGHGKAKHPMLPMIAIPTTAGTGSECQSYALIADETTHQKMACGDIRAAAAIALLDPTLTITQPREVTAHTGIDAIAHSIESAVTTRRNGISSLYSRRALQLTMEHFPNVMKHPQELESRGAMLQGAAFAGMAIENSMLGAAHSAANPLFAHFNVVHGEAVGLMLPWVIRYNGANAATAAIYRELALMIGLCNPEEGPEVAVRALADAVTDLLRLAGLPTCLSEVGAPESAIPQLAEEAASQWTAQFNPRKVGADDFVRLYEAAYD